MAEPINEIDKLQNELNIIIQQNKKLKEENNIVIQQNKKFIYLFDT